MGRPPDHPSGAKVPIGLRLTPQARDLLRRLAVHASKTQTQVLEELIMRGAKSAGLVAR